MRAAPLLLALALTPIAGCQSSPDCTLIACQDGVGVTLTGLGAMLAPSPPVTLKVCLDSTCSEFELSPTPHGPVCISQTNTLCTIDGEGNVVLKTLPLPPAAGGRPAAAGSTSLTVYATATNSLGWAVFGGSQMVTIVASQPNGPSCGPTCLGAEATISSS
jgi:hypothetical protein